MKKYKSVLCLIILFSFSLFGEVYTLDKSIQIALENNETVKIAKQQLEKSEYIYNEAYSGALPKVEANLTYLRNLYSSKIANMEYYFASFANGIAGLNNTILDLHPTADLSEMPVLSMPDAETEAMKNNTLKAELSLVQPIWLGGKIGTALEIARIFKKMNLSAYRMEKDKVTIDIKKNFYQILMLKESKKVMELVKADAYKNLDKIEKLYKEGLVSEYDLIQARVRVKSIEPKIISIDNYYELAKEYLKINMGVADEDPINISGELKEIISPDTLDIVDKAMANRIELKLLEFQKELLTENVTIEYSNHLPNIIGLASYSFQSQNDDLGDTFETNYGVGAFNVGITANIPIFNGFGTKAKVDQANVEVKKASLNILKTRKFIRLQLKDALSKLKLAEEELKLRDNEIAEYEKALEITQVRYDNGLCTQLELTGAQTSLESSRLNKVSTIHNYIIAMIDLESSTGIISETEFNILK
ncbi:MAG: TolC family protein [Candidatus Delongbacteria bacterium]|nr:TolC family protein [Candidatus Delongbacteria bacterium]MCG2760423.1 TolC family protein [Candidatus Delongbacteria bacterium]